MNISSVIVNLKDDSVLNYVLEALKGVKDCEIIAYENAKIVAVITVDDVNAEIAKFREIEALKGVSSVVMVYTYQEDIEFDKDKFDLSENVAEILKNDDIKAENIVYGGHVGPKLG